MIFGMHWLRAALLTLCLVATGCSGDGYDKAKYCGAVGPTVNGAVDDNGQRLDSFNAQDRQRSYNRLAKLGPPDLRKDWERIGAMVGASDLAGGGDPTAALNAVDATRRVTENVKKVCGFQITTF